MRAAEPISPTDFTLPATLFVLTVIYVAALPLFPGAADEGLFLYESRMLLDGKVLYRDMFEIITPGGYYLMAALFAALGTTLETARLAFAVVHGLIVAATYAAARAAGVRPSLAAAAAVVHVAAFQTVWPYASPHWLSTLLTVLLLRAMLVRPWFARARDLVLPGILVGALVAVQQQRGAVLAFGVALLVLADDRLARRSVPPESLSPLVARLAALVGGALLVVVPLALVVVAAAGTTPVVDALIRFPLVNYRSSNRVPWGYLAPFPEIFRFTWPRVLRYLPALAVVAAVRAVLVAFRGGDAARLRTLVMLSGTAAFATASIVYFPDLIHIAFIGPVLAVLAAELLESVVAGEERRAHAVRAAGWIAAVVVFLTVAVDLTGYLSETRHRYAVTHPTAFGRVDLPDRQTAALIDRVRAGVEAAGSHELFVYPGHAALYLFTGTTNPTRYQIMMPGYSSPAQLEETIATLDAHRVPYVLLVVPFLRPGDPVAEYVRRQYEHVEDRVGEKVTHVAVYRRREG